MPDFFDTTGIPDDPEHWDAVARRVAATARASRPSSLDWLASSRAAWVAASLLLVAAWVLMTPTERSSEKPLPVSWTEALTPKDGVGKAIVIRDSPPPIGALLLSATRAGER
jgi:hypothetical protein